MARAVRNTRSKVTEIFVYAGDATQALRVADTLGLKDEDWLWVSRPDMLQGEHEGFLFFAGTYQQRKDWTPDFQDMIKASGLQVRYTKL